MLYINSRPMGGFFYWLKSCGEFCDEAKRLRRTRRKRDLRETEGADCSEVIYQCSILIAVRWAAFFIGLNHVVNSATKPRGFAERGENEIFEKLKELTAA